MPVFEFCSEERAAAVRFSNGKLNLNDRDQVKLNHYAHKESGTRDASKRKRIITAEVDGLTYVGKNYGSANRFATDTCDYYIGVHDKKTGKMKVVAADLYQLEPWLKDKQSTDEVDVGTSSFREKNDALVKEFGSGRSQKAVSKRDKNKLDDEMVTLTTKSVIESSHTQEQAAVTSEPVKTETSAIPPYNKDATTPDEVYKLKDIISADMLSALVQQCQVFYNSTQEEIAKWREEKKYFSFVLDKLEAISIREDARLLQSQCLMYLQCLIHVYLMKAHQLRNKFPLPQEWPIPVKDHILNTFTLNIKEAGKRPQRCVPARMKDLLLSHILVLCLKLSQFELVLNPLMQDLATVPQKRLITHCTTLGCSVKKMKGAAGTEIHTAILTLPLKFPEVRGKSNKKRIF